MQKCNWPKLNSCIVYLIIFIFDFFLSSFDSINMWTKRFEIISCWFYFIRVRRRQSINKMGGGSSKPQDTKMVDSSGTVNNNVVVSQPVPIENRQLLILIWVICILRVAEFLWLLYREHHKSLKKKYANDGPS